MKEFIELFRGPGEVQHPCTISLKQEAVPFAITSPSRVPVPLMEPVERELNQMVSDGVIVPVEEPTEWGAPTVVVHMKNGNVRICVDCTTLNKSVLREYHPIPSVEHTLGMLGNARHFSKIDGHSGFYQVTLSSESSKLTTFVTPFGRHIFKKCFLGYHRRQSTSKG